MMQTFWMVWKDIGDRPQVKHWTEEDAHAEAKRLADANPGRTFFVLKAVASYGASGGVTALEGSI